jgi:hypothetical protein
MQSKETTPSPRLDAVQSRLARMMASAAVRTTMEGASEDSVGASEGDSGIEQAVEGPPEQPGAALH